MIGLTKNDLPRIRWGNFRTMCPEDLLEQTQALHDLASRNLLIEFTARGLTIKSALEAAKLEEVDVIAYPDDVDYWGQW